MTQNDRIAWGGIIIGVFLSLVSAALIRLCVLKDHKERPAEAPPVEAPAERWRTVSEYNFGAFFSSSQRVIEIEHIPSGQLFMLVVSNKGLEVMELKGADNHGDAEE